MKLFRQRAGEPRVHPSLRVPVPRPPGERVRDCGWFDSSHELQRGLVVMEHNAALEAEWLSVLSPPHATDPSREFG